MSKAKRNECINCSLHGGKYCQADGETLVEVTEAPKGECGNYEKKEA